ncbi:MAG: hypothetical protein Q4B99_01705 [Clostridia bacterium]|nr:hypothetical protein [Clostridia bacterium]
MLYEDKLKRILEQQHRPRESEGGGGAGEIDDYRHDSKTAEEAAEEYRQLELELGKREARRQRRLREKANSQLEKGDFAALLISAYGVLIPVAILVLGLICAVVVLIFGRGLF